MQRYQEGRIFDKRTNRVGKIGRNMNDKDTIFKKWKELKEETNKAESDQDINRIKYYICKIKRKTS